ncbi:phosphotransferase family protein [Nocardioides sp. SR21]|uniref:phosphotransferase family protein n=1 Tax=Nocardioides sp. SR21 TaxID=2919501 RepID=UPI001FAA2357|nr:phosphotransferase [Nocardioides sp. SR21]
MAPSELLQDAVRREALAGHDGKSGAGLERVWLADGRALVVKRVIGTTVAPEHLLWRSGILDRLPPGVGHAIVDGWVEDDHTTVIVMRDLGDAVLSWDRPLSTASTRVMVERLAAMHRAFLDAPPDGLAPLTDVLEMFAPHRLTARAEAGSAMCALILRAWEVFVDTVPAEVADPVMTLLADTTGLAAAMNEGPVTFLHGDLAAVNMAIEGDDLVLFDWATATVGPGVLDIARTLAASSSMLEPSREEILATYAGAAGPAYDERSERLALLATLGWLGWNKALDAVEHPDPAIRAQEQQDLAWWVHQARTTLESGDLSWI